MQRRVVEHGLHNIVVIKPAKLGSLKEGRNIVIDGEPCRIVEVENSVARVPIPIGVDTTAIAATVAGKVSTMPSLAKRGSSSRPIAVWGTAVEKVYTIIGVYS